jgi:two-component system, NtrC family, sensor kinase
MTADEKVNILMVDDQPAKLLSYEVILGELGENLIKATSAREALSILLRNDIAVVLMDVSMPELDGFELADMIREHPRFGKTAIIFISGVHLTDTDKINGYRRGAVDYISVPVIPEVLRAKIGVFVELHRKTRQLERLNSDLERRVEERTEELRQSEAHHRERAELLELATEAIIVRDLNDNIRFWNAGAESLYGWHRGEIIGRNLHQTVHTTFPVPREQVEQALQSVRSWQGNLTTRTKDGRELVVSTRKVLNREGNAVLEIQRDITAQMQAEEALRQAEKLAAMGRVAGIIAHEINNPLEAITNAFYLLRNHQSLDEEARYYASLAEQELQRASHITRQTLSFYRDSKQPITVSVPDLLDNVVELQQRPIALSRINLQKKYSSPGVVRGFPGELRQVFLNLISNAIQAMPAGGTLRLRVADAADPGTQRRGIVVSVTDTGGGIRPEDAKRLFQPFFTTKSAKGTGLGLWISKGIVQKYEGRIHFRSYRAGAGACTCFRVFLPVSGETAAGESSRDQDLSPGAPMRAIA